MHDNLGDHNINYYYFLKLKNKIKQKQRARMMKILFHSRNIINFTHYLNTTL